MDIDMVVALEPGQDPKPWAEAGATWWGRWIPPGPRSEAHKILQAGPPRLT